MKLFKSLILLLGMTLPCLALNPAVIPTTTNIAGLQSLGLAAPQFPTIQVLGYYTANDGGGGLFSWSPASTASTDVCMTFQATGVTIGRYIRNLGASQLSTLQCGVKADSSGTTLATDNTTELQAWSDAAITYGLGSLYCPSATGKIGFASTVNLHVGVTYRGQNNTYNAGLGSETNPGACVFLYTGTAVAMDLQTPVTAVCPQQQAPSFYDFTLEAQAASNGIRLNNPATANFTDICSSGSQGQSILSGGVMSGLVIPNGPRVATAVQFAKVFNYVVEKNFVNFWDTAFSFYGSDNIDFHSNTMNDPLIQSLLLTGEGTFGNEFHAHENTFNDMYTGASYNVNIQSYLSVVLVNNYFEDAQFVGTGTSAAVNISSSGPGNYNISNNGMFVAPAFTPNWLRVSGVAESLALYNNFDGGANPPAIFVGGYPVMYNLNLAAQIHGNGNPDGNGGIPYLLQDQYSANNYHNQSLPPAISGSVLANVNPSSPQGASSTYATNLKVDNQSCFIFQPLSGSTGNANFAVRPVVNATVDVWAYMYSDTASGSQTMGMGLNGGALTQQIVTTSAAWYNVLTNQAVSDPVLNLDNTDTTHASNVHVCNVTFVKH